MNLSYAVQQVLGDINPESAALAGVLDSDAPSKPTVPMVAPVQLLVEQVAGVSLVKDDDEYPDL